MWDKVSFKMKLLIGTITVVIVFAGLFFYNRINSYAYDYPVGGNLNALISKTVDEINIDLGIYGLKKRKIERGYPNETGLKITYNDGSWLYIDEYANVVSENSGISEINLSDQWLNGHSPREIVGFELAAGYEVILQDIQGNTTQIMGPLRLLGVCESEYEKQSSKKISEQLEDITGDTTKMIESLKSSDASGTKYEGFSEKGSAQDEKGKYEDDVDVTAKKMRLKTRQGSICQIYNKLWDYNHVKCWSVPGEKKDGKEEYDRKNVKIYDITKIKLKKTTLKEGVYLMKDVYNIVNGPKGQLEDENKKPTGSFEYIAPELPSIDLGDTMDDNEGVMRYYPYDLRTKEIVNSLMIVGPYKVRIQREKDKVGKGTKTQRVEIVGQEGKIINIVNFWRLNDTDGKSGPHVTNDFSWIEIYPLVEDTKKDDTKFYNECVVFRDKNWDKVKHGKVQGDSLSRYEMEIKVCDIPHTEEDPAVTAYTETDFKGQYFRLYRGETDNIGYDKDIARIRSLEVGPNTRVVFSDKENCDLSLTIQNYDKTTNTANNTIGATAGLAGNASYWRGLVNDRIEDINNNNVEQVNFDQYEPNYGKINGVDTYDANLVVIEGPCAIDNLEEYLLNYYVDGNTIKENNLYSRLKSFTVKAQPTEGSDYLLYTKPGGAGVFSKGKFEKDKDNKIELGNYFPQSITINGNYFVKFYDKDGNRVKTLVGPLKNARIGLDNEYRDLWDNLNEKLHEFLLYTNDYSIRNKLAEESRDKAQTNVHYNLNAKPEDFFGGEGYSVAKVLISEYGFDELATKVRERYLYVARDILNDVYKDYRLVRGNPDWQQNGKQIFQEKLKEFARNYIKLYYNAKDIPAGQSWIKDYVEDEDGKVKENVENAEIFKFEINSFLGSEITVGGPGEVLKALRAECKDAIKAFTDIKNKEYNIAGKTQSLQEHLCDMYAKYDNMTMQINSSTQRDTKGRSLENIDGIVLYENKDYNQNIRPEENVWTSIRVNEDGNFIWNNSTSKRILLASASNAKKMEIDYKKIGSIKISGSLLGKYKIILELGDGKKIESRNNIKDLEELAKTTYVKTIAIEKMEDNKDFDILLDSPVGGLSKVTTDGIKVKTTDIRVEKAGDFVEDSGNLEKEIEREVYLVDILEVSDKIGLRHEYMYKYDMDDMDKSELVGVKFSRDIGILKKNEQNKQAYQNVDTNVKNIVRDIEVKFNQDEESLKLALMGVRLPWGVNGEPNTNGNGEYISSQEYNQTKDSKNLIITDHGYLEDKNNIKNDSTVLVRNYRDVMEVPAMLIKEVKVTKPSSSNEGDSSSKEVRYLEIAKDISEFNATPEKISKDNNRSSKLHLYIPACYKENGSWHTSYILSQLGIKATDEKGKIGLS